MHIGDDSAGAGAAVPVPGSNSKLQVVEWLWHLEHQKGLSIWAQKWKNLTPEWEHSQGYWPIYPGRLTRPLSLPHFIRFPLPAAHPGQLPCAPAQLGHSVVLSVTARSFQLTCKRLFSSSDGTLLCLPYFRDPRRGQTSCWVSVLRCACCWSCSCLPVGTCFSPLLCHQLLVFLSLFWWLILVVWVRLLFLDNAQCHISGSSFTISIFKVLQHKYLATVMPAHT